MTWSEAAARQDGLVPEIAGWFKDYVMRPHPDLGRTGHVCPYMAQSTRLDLVRIVVSELTPDRPDDILRLVQAGADVFDGLLCPVSKRMFRSVVIAFPGCAGTEGTAALEGVQHALRYRSAVGRRMVGLFEPASAEPGILNRSFHSFRAPVPMIAIRSLVELDAPFVLRNPAMAPFYLWRFKSAGCRRLSEAFRERWADRRRERAAA